MSVLCDRWVMTLATNALADDPTEPSPGRAPYPTPLFYAVAKPPALGPGPVLVFVTDPSTRHGRHLGRGPSAVAVGIYLETEELGLIRGIQVRGEAIRVDSLDPERAALARRVYIERHPVAAPMLEGEGPEQLYAICVRWAKLTDNRLGMGVHPQWQFASAWSETAQNGP